MSVFLDIFLFFIFIANNAFKKEEIEQKSEGCEICRKISHLPDEHLPTNYMNYKHVINTLNIKQPNIPDRF